MKFVIMFLSLLLFELAKGQSEIKERPLIQDASPINEEKEHVIDLVMSDIEKNSVNVNEFLAMLKENPLTVKLISQEQQEKNDFFIVKGKVDAIDIVGNEDVACEINCRYDYWYNFKMYLPLHRDFYGLKKGDLVYAFINIGEIEKYNIVCDVALAASTPKILAEKFIALYSAIQDEDVEDLKMLLDVGSISSFNCKNCNFENSIRFFMNYLRSRRL